MLVLFHWQNGAGKDRGFGLEKQLKVNDWWSSKINEGVGVTFFEKKYFLSWHNLLNSIPASLSGWLMDCASTASQGSNLCRRHNFFLLRIDNGSPSVL